MKNQWCEIFEQSAKLTESGNWSAAVWRAHELAKAASCFLTHTDLIPIKEIQKINIHHTMPSLHAKFYRTKQCTPNSIPVISSRGTNGQICIQSMHDEYLIDKKQHNSYLQYEIEDTLQKSGYLLITWGQCSSTTRLTAVAGNKKYVGIYWLPVTGLNPKEAKATAIFLNSTPGRLQLMSNASRALRRPIYHTGVIKKIRIPDITDTRICNILSDCWERTKNIKVPQFKDGECEVRALWDASVSDAMQWDVQELTRLRLLLHKEPHVCGLSYNEQ